MSLYAGIDLHGNNAVVAVLNEEDKVIFKKKLPNDLEKIKMSLEPHKGELEGIAVESTYNWYWLVDGLMEHGYQVHLAHAPGLNPYSGTKFTDDEDDAMWLAHLLRLGILPEGFIYPKEDRPVRDLLRRRGALVRQRTSHILSYQGLCARQLGRAPGKGLIERLDPDGLMEVFGDEYLALAGQNNLVTIQFLNGRIAELEKAVLERDASIPSMCIF